MASLCKGKCKDFNSKQITRNLFHPIFYNCQILLLVFEITIIFIFIFFIIKSISLPFTHQSVCMFKFQSFATVPSSIIISISISSNIRVTTNTNTATNITTNISKFLQFSYSPRCCRFKGNALKTFF